jgi:hypothetical protein
MIIDGTITSDCTDSSIYGCSEPSAYEDTDQYGSGISVDLLQSSGISSGVSSGATSESDLPPPPPPPSQLIPSKPVHQTGLHNFFSAVPADELHAIWREKKRKNRDRDEEERIEGAHQEEEWKQEKLQVRREHNCLSQQKHRKRIKVQEIQAGMRDEDGSKIQVRQIFT